MQPFKYQREENSAAAVAALAQLEHSKFLAGGTNLIDLMKNGVERPAALLDINRLPLAKIEALPDGGLRLGAMARNSDTANHPLVRGQYPLLAYAILSASIAATAQSGHQWRQSFAAHALSLFHGYGFHAVQQARSGQRVRRD